MEGEERTEVSEVFHTLGVARPLQRPCEFLQTVDFFASKSLDTPQSRLVGNVSAAAGADENYMN